MDADVYEIFLPDDDPEAMTTLCHVLHLNSSELLPVNDISRLKGFAVAAD